LLASQRATNIRVNVEIGNARLQDNAVLVDVTFINPTDHSIFFLPWNTPFDALSPGLFFEVYLQGEAVPYTGAIAKRTLVPDEKLVHLQAHEEITTTVEISQYFDFSLSGNYRIRMVDTLTRIRFESDHVRITLPKGLPKSETKTIAVLPGASNSYVDCTSADQSVVVNAWGSYQSYVADIKTDIALGSSSTRYPTWFGTYTSSRWNTVSSTISNLSTWSSSGGVAFNCDPPRCGGPGTFAYVYPTDPVHTVHLCNQFWKAPLKGYNSQGGTIVHEMSHFSDIGGTQDYVYGAEGAEDLASTSPDKAIKNADNYEYYAEL